MTVQPFTVNPFEENCYVCHSEGEAVVIDPGTLTAAEQAAVTGYLREHGLRVRRLLLTHAHLDHIFGCAFFARTYGLGFEMHEADVPLLEHAHVQAELFGYRIETPPPPAALLAEGDVVAFGGARWRVLHCPGHSPGSICFHDEAAGVLVAGDVLFSGAIGRTDLWMGSPGALLASIREKLLVLPDETVVYPGHGRPTTIGRERETNPFL